MITEDLNASEFLLARGESDAAALYLLDGTCTYGQLHSVIDDTARLLIQLGAGKGERVVLLADNSLFWVSSYLAILRTGAICVPLPTTITSTDLSFITTTTEARIACLQPSVYERNRTQFNRCGVITPDRMSRDGGRSWIRIPDALSSSIGAIGYPAGTEDDVASLMYTSGSTAKPRGVVITHGNIIANTNSIIQYLSLTRADRIMAVLPFHYCFGTSLLHTHLRVGGSLVIDNRFMYPEAVLQRMRDTECTGFAGVPSHYQILLRRTGFARMSFPHLRYVQQAGGHLAPIFIKELRRAQPQVKVYVMYGQTEATARLAYVPPDLLDEKLGSIGKAIPGVTLRVLNQAGGEVKPAEEGEIVAQGKNIARGYWNDPQETAACFRNGKLYTGDLATVDEDGFIYVVDRAKDFIKCGGKRVSCRNIEEQLLEFEDVLEIAVIGVPDPLLGEAVKIFVVPKQKKQNGFAEHFQSFCKDKLPFQLLPREIVTLESLPKNNAGKILKQVLRNA